jgi:hypothetical protein
MKKLNHLMRYGILLLFSLINLPVNAGNITVRMLGSGPVWSPIRINGTITGADFTNIEPQTSVSWSEPRLIMWVSAFRYGGQVWRSQEEMVGSNGMAVKCSPDTLSNAVQTVNQYLATGPTFSGATPLNVDFDQLTVGIQITCRTGPAGTLGTRYDMWNPMNTEIVNPPFPSASVCSLYNSVSLSYSSTALDVNGLSQSASLGVSCTSGTAKDYMLRLTSSNVSNGRLVFGNGVTALVYLNGTAMDANGSGIRLNSLTTRSIPVRADLFGTASSSGTTTVNGILILDAL